MPERILREGILDSELINALSPGAEIFYRRLMSVVDDYGRFTANPALLRARLYALQLDRVSQADISMWLAEVSTPHADACGCMRMLVKVYTIDGKSILEMQNTRQRFRASKSKWPAPTDAITENKRDESILACERQAAACARMIMPSETETETETETRERAYRKSPSVVAATDAASVPPPQTEPKRATGDPAPPEDAEAPPPTPRRDTRAEIAAERDRVVQDGWRELSERYPNRSEIDAAAWWWISECGRCRDLPTLQAYIQGVLDGLRRHLGPPVCAAWADHQTGALRPEFVPPLTAFLGEKPWRGSRIASRLWQDLPPAWQPRGKSATVAPRRDSPKCERCGDGGRILREGAPQAPADWTEADFVDCDCQAKHRSAHAHGLAAAAPGTKRIEPRAALPTHTSSAGSAKSSCAPRMCDL